MFKYKEDIIPVSIIMFISILDFLMYFYVENIYTLIGYFLLMIIPKGVICSWNHHHQHVNVFKSKYLNRLIEFFYGLHSGATTNLWVLHHNLGHHRNYLDQSKDESAWQDKNGKTMGYWKYSFNIMFTSYYRAWKVGSKYTKQRTEMIIYSLLLLGAIMMLTFINPINTILLFIAPMILSLFLTSQATYNHHSELNTDDKFSASRTDLNSFWNLLTGNLGYHTAHHIKPNAHWSKLPTIHKSIEDKIPKKNIENNIF